MIRDEDIPSEVVEAAIRRVYAVSGGTQWDKYPEEAKGDDRKQIRAAIAAALSVWPGALCSSEEVIDGELLPPIISLPFPRN
jgi:ABC-type histidine transport system ATPase subunit